jgi:hypothetical protein
MSFTYAGNLGGAGAPVVRRFHTNESMYVGMFAQSVGAGGQVGLLDVPATLNTTTTHPIGAVTGIVDGSRAYTAATSGTSENGEGTTYTTTKSVVADTGISEVEVILAIPGVTLFRAPIYRTSWGTALQELVCAAEDSTGKSMVATAANTADVGNVLGMIYCRSGANRGIYRTIATVSTVTFTTTAPFPNTIAAGDIFVTASCLLGFGNIMSTAYADCINGDLTGADGHSVYFHEINLEESGKEYAIFCLWGGTAPAAA